MVSLSSFPNIAPLNPRACPWGRPQNQGQGANQPSKNNRRKQKIERNKRKKECRIQREELNQQMDLVRQEQTRIIHPAKL